MRSNLKILIVFLSFALCHCAVLHHVQLSDIDGSAEYVKVPIEVKVSEMGVSMNDIKNIANSTHTRTGKDVGNTAEFINNFQMGPRTGAPVYSDKYAEKIVYELHTKCPTGKITGVMSVRESREYPVIKGEIVKITAYCLRPRS
jgi:hypothetical protein